MRAADLECRLQVVEILTHDLQGLLRRLGDAVLSPWEVSQRLTMIQSAVNGDYQQAVIIHDDGIVRKIEHAIRRHRAVVDGLS